ncbi:arginine repressor [Alloscardovia venturai]|uniref:Arginine repressor n=1 Tax=Alloscardovia venturai TaxID=1769421 RepID=A0ABW2Y4R4_9BIFI
MNAGVPTTRTARLSIVESIILHHVIESQQQLADLLADEGIQVTQATLSRDLDDLKASKVRTPSGTFAYAVPQGAQYAQSADSLVPGPRPARMATKAEQQLSKVIGGLITKVIAAQNLVIIHTPAGAAQYVASAIDKQPIADVAGTIAGDDTVMVIASDNQAAQKKRDWLLEMASNAR